MLLVNTCTFTLNAYGTTATSQEINEHYTFNSYVNQQMHLIQFMTNLNLIHVSAPGCHPQRVFQLKGIKAQHVNLGTHCPHWSY
jgi:hypothetical protein